MSHLSCLSSTVSSSLSVIFLGLPWFSSQSKGIKERSEKFLFASSSYSLYHSVILRGLVGALKKQPVNFLCEDGAVKLITSILFFCLSENCLICDEFWDVSRSMRRRELMRTAFSLPAGRTAKSYVASGAGLGRGLGTAGYGGLTRKDPPEIETAAGRATAGRVVPIAIPNTRDGLLSSVKGTKSMINMSS